MKTFKTSMKAVAGLLLTLAVVALAINCGKKDASKASASMVIVNTTGNVVVESAGQEKAASVGMVVKESDIIKTTDGTADLQNKNGSAVRVREFTTIEINSLLGGGKSDTRLTMKHGSVMAKVEKKAANETFKVVTPTAIAGVRGTTFTVEAEEGEPTRVKVIDGAVAMSPRIKALEEVTEEDLKENPELQAKLKDLEELAQKQEKLIEARHEGKLDAGVEKAVAELNTKTEAVDGKVEKMEALKTSVADVEKSVEAAESVQVEKVEISKEDLTEKETLITADEETIEKLQAGETKAVDKLIADRNAKQEEVLQKIEKEAAAQKFDNDEEIRKHYKKLESLQLKDGSVITGAVIAQTGSVLVVQTADGVKRINTANVVGITYP